MATRRESVHYRIVPIDPVMHLFEVTITINKPATEGQLFSLPAWIPGTFPVIAISCGTPWA